MHIPTYHVWKMEQKAVEFHAAYCSAPILVPVDIELIIEKRLGFDILPIDNLKREHDTYGCLVKDGKTHAMIGVVDEYMMANNETTYRFTLAEEVAHHILHKEVFQQAGSLHEWAALCRSVPARSYWQMDRNAKYLAGALLMPEAPLNHHVRDVYEESFAEAEVLNGKALRALLARRLAPLYNVSDEHAMFYRLDNQAVFEMKNILIEHRFFLEPE